MRGSLGDAASEAGLRSAPSVLEEIERALIAAADTSSFSPELGSLVTSEEWETHVSPARANIIRPLDLSRAGRALVVDAGAGALGRHVAENCRAVDLLEADSRLARIARARVADLDHVRVIDGYLRDLPREAEYDLVVWIVDGALRSAEEFTASLSAATKHLSRNGTLVLGIDNPLAVRYLAGHADDRTGRPFDAPEGFSIAPHAYLPERATLEGLLRGLGLDPTTYAVLSGHRTATAITTQDAFVHYPGLVSELRQLTVPPPGSVSALDERGLWRRLSNAGVAHEFAESYLVLASRGAAPRLWPAELLAAHFTPRRRVELMTRVDFTRGPHGLMVRRRLLRDPELRAFDASEDLRWEAADENFIEGEWLLGAVWDADDPVPMLARWSAFVREQREELLDLNPANIKITDSGLAMYDQEWIYPTRSTDMKILYGLVDTAYSRALVRRAHASESQQTVRKIAGGWARALGIPFSDEDVLAMTADDARLRPQIDLLPGDLTAVHAWLLDTPVAELRPTRIDLLYADARKAAQPPLAPRGPRSLLPARWYPYT